jgi:hypothetical protein
LGDIIRVTCNKCDVEREEFVGVGMMALGHELCACYSCKRFVLKKLKWQRGVNRESFACPYCRESITPVQDNDQCPLCDGIVQVDHAGLWD